MNKELILVLDIGTTGGRAFIFDQDGQIMLSSYREYEIIILSQGIINQDPQVWLSAIRDCMADLKKADPVLVSGISAVSVTSQRATLLPVDENGTPLASAILWQDNRSVGECAEIENNIGSDEIYRRTGLKINPYFSLPKLLWFKNQMPDLYQKTAYFLTTHDYVIHSLTGEFKTDWTQASRTMLFNINDFQWDSFICGKMKLAARKLPEAYPAGTIAGTVTKASAEKLGLPEKVPVIMAGGDQTCAAVGLGVIAPGIVNITTGTGSFILAPVDKPARDPEQKIICSASAVPGRWVLEAGILTTGATYRWLRDELLSSDIQYSTLEPYEVLNREAEKSPPGANGVLHIPHYAGSASPYWDTRATGLLFNLSLGTKKSDVVRAYLEGVCYEIKKNLDIIDVLLKGNENQSLAEVRVSGGLVRSGLFNQIQADIYEVNVIPGQTEQATALGAAMIGFVSTGSCKDLNEAIHRLGTLDRDITKRPNPKTAAIYRKMGELHHKIYTSLSETNVYLMADQIES